MTEDFTPDNTDSEPSFDISEFTEKIVDEPEEDEELVELTPELLNTLKQGPQPFEYIEAEMGGIKFKVQSATTDIHDMFNEMARFTYNMKRINNGANADNPTLI